jgi:hypothetical protein
MNKKIIIDTEEIKNKFRNTYDHATKGMHHKHQRRFMLENEVKLFTNKDEMVSYVNGLTQIENVEIFKIEDHLYKVLITRLKKVEAEECCKEESKECCKEDSKDES